MTYAHDSMNPVTANPAVCHQTRNADSEVIWLHAEIERLQREIVDYQIALSTSNEHGDLLEEHLYRLSTSLTAEIRERQSTEEKLQKLLQAISQEKGDLEVLVQILIDQGDSAAEEGEKARIDGLTQIANRRRFDEYLHKEWVRHADLRQPLALLLCDVDFFKSYNDLYGHQTGDECLRTVAGVIDECCGDSGVVARYGGEEFAAVLPHTTSETAMQRAQSVLSAIRAAAVPHAKSTICRSITLSIGVACWIPQSHGGRDEQTLLEEADRNLYLAKHRGRNRAEY